MRLGRVSLGGIRAVPSVALVCSTLALGQLPRSAWAVAQEGPPKTATAEFSALCSGLADARSKLSTGEMDEATFSDTLLDLFARTDSLATSLRTAARDNPATITLQRGTSYLIVSLRENWIGIAEQNGMSFAEADLALKAAVAWRSNLAEALPTP